MHPPRPRLTTRSVDSRSVGFVLAGASTIAAQRMIAAIRQQPPASGSDDVAGAWVVGVQSQNERRAREFAGRHGIVHTATDLPSLLERPEVQVVYVSNLPRRHAETVRMALAAQKHVLCEPPLALEWAEAQSLAQMAAHRGLVLAMNYVWRASPVVHRIHELLQDDTIGELLAGRIQNTAYLPPAQQTWRLQPDGGGVLLDRTLHDVDLVQSLLHGAVREAYAHATHRVAAGSVEEEIVAYLKLTGGMVVQIFDSFLQPHAPVMLELYGAGGALRGQDCGPAGVKPALQLVHAGEVTDIPVEAIDPYRAAVGRLLAAMRGAAPPLADGEDELRNLAVLQALNDSAAHGRAMAVKLHEMRSTG
jgi:1,5-anhydro-D-fructose reductase (1,5-anhydro-D-mannitol-forming)